MEGDELNAVESEWLDGADDALVIDLAGDDPGGLPPEDELHRESPCPVSM